MSADGSVPVAEGCVLMNASGSVPVAEGCILQLDAIVQHAPKGYMSGCTVQ
jgi:hypothetical protein